MDSGGWARVLYDARGGMEKIIFISKTEPVPSPGAASPPHKHRRLASARRQARDKRRRGAWAERRRNRSQPRPHTHSMEDENTPRPASAAVSVTPLYLHKRSHPSRHLRHRSCHHSRGKGPRHIVKLCAPAVVLRFLPSPLPPPSPSPSTLCQPAIEFEFGDEPPLQSETLSAPLALQAPAPPQVLSPHRAPSLLVSASGIRSPAPSAVQPAEASTSPRSGYTLIMIWCPFCKKNLIDNHDFECYTCQEKKILPLPSIRR
jgi:hypothetical protein